MNHGDDGFDLAKQAFQFFTHDTISSKPCRELAISAATCHGRTFENQ
jgi:hypothetical protein